MKVLSLMASLFSVEPSSTPLTCETLTDFTDATSNAAWVTVNDNVMGGRSEGGMQITNGKLVFAGTINTNGGGFSSISWPIPTGTLKNAALIRVTMKPDGRQYKMNFRTSARVRAPQIVYQGQLATSSGPAWQDVDLHLDSLVPTIFGRRLDSAPDFNASAVASLGFIIADEKDGPFLMSVDRIQYCY
ncbi:MAG: CIA30 family protein [Aquisalinus sp.]|nr:CIA30 family protein [Aquisalinus sp.]